MKNARFRADRFEAARLEKLMLNGVSSEKFEGSRVGSNDRQWLGTAVLDPFLF